jgi:uncharacterized small protein (DUF1192 family)
MDIDDLEPRRPTLAPVDMEKMSIDDLKDYIAKLEAEIARANGFIDAKQGHRSEADKFFKL